jgi:hypothetical protein
MKKVTVLVFLIVLLIGLIQASDKTLPTLNTVSYGKHPRQVLDFWKAPSAEPTPLVFYVHGGGWVKGDKNNIKQAERYLNSGISVVSINYRYSWQAQLAGTKPPVEWPMHDAARALQFVRSKATEWNIDKHRIGISGSPLAHARHYGLLFTTTWLIPRALIRWNANLQGYCVRRYTSHRLRWTRNKCGRGRLIATMAAMLLVLWIRTT